MDFLSDLVSLCDYRQTAAFRLVTRFRADSRHYRIDHGYTYGLNFINFNITNPSYRELLDTIDNECHARLRAYGTPPAILEWDGWQYPSNHDIACLYDILDGKKQTAEEDYRSNRGWAIVGTTGIFEFLDGRHRNEVQEFAWSHPVHLPSFPEIGDAPSPSPSSPVDHMTMPSASTVDHTTVLELGETDVDMGTGTDILPLVKLNTPVDTPLT